MEGVWQWLPTEPVLHERLLHARPWIYLESCCAVLGRRGSAMSLEVTKPSIGWGKMPFPNPL